MFVFQWLWELLWFTKQSDDCPDGGKHDWKMFTRQYFGFGSPGSDRCTKCGQTKRVNEEDWG